MILKGADISKWQGQIDFDKFKNGLDFVIIRSSYGNGYVDGQFARNRDEARRVGFLVGYYHYAYPNNNTAEQEADWFCKVVGKPNKGEIMVLDFEEQHPDPVGWSVKFLKRLESNLGGYKAMIYLNQSQMKTYDWQPVIDLNCGLWLAQYDYNPDGVPVKTDWNFVAMRQYTNKANFPGVVGNVDGNVFYGDVGVFKAYGYGGGTVTPTPTPAIQQLPKDSVIGDIYEFMTGVRASSDEIKWRLQSEKNLVEIGNDIAGGDNRFFDRWVKPKIPVAEITPIPPSTCPEPSPVIISNDEAIAKVKQIVSSKQSLIQKIQFLVSLLSGI